MFGMTGGRPSITRVVIAESGCRTGRYVARLALASEYLLVQRHEDPITNDRLQEP